MPSKRITYCGQPMIVSCDGICSKAWGINSRPRIDLSSDPDDFAWPADHELGAAPVDPGTYEGDDAKPLTAASFPNRWCVRECERCSRHRLGEPITLRRFGARVPNRC